MELIEEDSVIMSEKMADLLRLMGFYMMGTTKSGRICMTEKDILDRSFTPAAKFELDECGCFQILTTDLNQSLKIIDDENEKKVEFKKKGKILTATNHNDVMELKIEDANHLLMYKLISSEKSFSLEAIGDESFCFSYTPVNRSSKKGDKIIDYRETKNLRKFTFIISLNSLFTHKVETNDCSNTSREMTVLNTSLNEDIIDFITAPHIMDVLTNILNIFNEEFEGNRIYMSKLGFVSIYEFIEEKTAKRLFLKKPIDISTTTSDCALVNPSSYRHIH